LSKKRYLIYHLPAIGLTAANALSANVFWYADKQVFRAKNKEILERGVG
jgi:hypothetical protein